MFAKLNSKSSFWAVVLVVLVLVSAGALKAKQVFSRSAEVGANVVSVGDANIW